jgi:hypothetical protein
MKTKTKYQCEKCLNWFSAKGGNYKRHIKSCNGIYKPPTQGSIKQCKHCKQEFDICDKPKRWMANHSRWCKENPKRKHYVDKARDQASVMRESKKKTGIYNQYSYGATCSQDTKEKLRRAQTGKTHTKETKQKIKEKALASNHRRLRKGTVEYKGIVLDSSWELELAKRLDHLNIEWHRPDPLPWVDENGIKHNYFPDFYLPKQDKYLDPKNKHAIKVQQKKLKKLLTQYNNIVIIDSLEGCKTFNV